MFVPFGRYSCPSLWTDRTQAERDPDDQFAEGAFEQLVAEAAKKDDKKEKKKRAGGHSKAKEDESWEEVQMPSGGRA